MENPVKIDDLGGTIIFGNTHIVHVYTAIESYYSIGRVLSSATHLHQLRNINYQGDPWNIWERDITKKLIP